MIDQTTSGVGFTPLVDQMGANITIMYALEGLKHLKMFPWVTRETDKINRTIAWVTAALVGLGIGMSFDWEHHAMTITGLDPSTIITNLWYAGRSVGLQQWIYDVRKSTLKPAEETS